MGYMMSTFSRLVTSFFTTSRMVGFILCYGCLTDRQLSFNKIRCIQIAGLILVISSKD